MKVFIRASQNAFPETEAEYTAYQGFSALGIMPELYTKEEDIDDCGPYDLIVGRVSTVTKKLRALGADVQEYDYPEELSDYLGRHIWKDTLEAVLKKKNVWPVFVKPIKDKAFAGFVLRNENDVPRLYRATPDEPVLCSELITFETEWRVFVRYGNIIDVRPYSGDWKNHYDTQIIESAVDRFKTAPTGYAIDFGVTDRGETVLVEVNDGFALGTYGIEPVQYAKLLSARWCELVGIHDEYDQYFEAVDWKKKQERNGYVSR